MSKIARSATIQARVEPGIKRTSEDILHRMGLTMTEAVELFLRRVISDEKLPFVVRAIEAEKLQAILERHRP